jgi:ferric-dicitrate binding protein FerR (iron transport regulator)
MQKEVNFKNLITKFLVGEISDNEMDLLKAWLEKDISNRRIFDEQNELWQESGVITNPDPFKIDKAWEKLSDHVGIFEKNVKPYLIINKNYFGILITAASVACLVAIVGLTLWLMELRSFNKLAVSTTTVQTNEGEKASIFLSDSTQVVLNSGSNIKYATDYNNNERIVRLTGEAFFNVRTNPERPFVVEMGKMTVTATGTRFNVLSYCNEDRMEATLEEGKIKVSIIGKEIIDLKSGQQVVYSSKTNKVIVREVTTETYTSWNENKLRFIDTPFEEVLRKIARRYNVTFEIKNRELLDLKYTATFIDESIEDVMQMLKSVSPITYEIHNRTTIDDKQYLKPKIFVGKRKVSKI